MEKPRGERRMSSTDEQREIVELLSRPEAHAPRPSRVEHHQTPLSHVFVAGPYAYKLKKPVTLSFVDFGTEERRHATCEDEVRLNRRLCPSIYLGVVPVTREENGALALGGGGTPVEHLVWMRSLPAQGMLPVALDAGRISPGLMRDFARDLAAFHARVPNRGPRVADAEPERLRRRWDDVLDNCGPSIGAALSRADAAILSDFGGRFLATHRELFLRRGPDGRIRECHGDLHAANLCWIEVALPALDRAPPVEPGLYAFDCIEFSERLRWNDVASEVAFLVMDLEVRGRRDLARAFLEAYEEQARDPDLPRLLPYYGAHRACVRAMVHAQTSRDEGESPERRAVATRRAGEFLGHAARAAWCATGPFVIACAGLSGTGKTALAAKLQERTGFVHLSSDEIRKRTAGLDPLSRTPAEKAEELYGPDSRHRVYEELARRTGEVLAEGTGVIADATFTRAADRARLAEAARERDVPFVFVECTAPEAVVRRRLETRAEREVPPTHGARSDADWAVYRKQTSEAEPIGSDEPRLAVDTSSRPLADLAEDLLPRLWNRLVGGETPL